MDEYFTAIKKGDRAAVERHLAADRSLAGAKDRDGLSAVLTALYHEEPEVAALILARKPPLDVFEAAAAGDLARVKELVEREGALASAYSPDGFFPLGLAAFFRRPDVVEYLLAKGADVSARARNPMQVTALHAAVADGGHPGIARAARGRRSGEREAAPRLDTAARSHSQRRPRDRRAAALAWR